MTAGDQVRDRHYSLLKITFPVDNWACVPVGKQFSVGIVLSAENLTALWAIFLWRSYRSLEDGKSIFLQSWRHISLMSRIKKIMSPSGAKVRHIFLHPFKDWSSLCSGLLMGKGKLLCGQHPLDALHCPMALGGQGEPVQTWSSCCLLCYK